MEVALIISMVVGVVFVVVSLYMMRVIGLKNKDEFDDVQQAIQKALGEFDVAFDTAMLEMNKTSRMVFNELDEKYQAMLFLYNLVDEKKKEVTAMQKPDVQLPQGQAPLHTVPMPQPTAFRKHPKYSQIKEFHAGGMSIADIAQNLNMGQGEVKLILDLGEK